MSKGFLNFCKLIANLLLGQIIVSNVTNVHKLNSRINSSKVQNENDAIRNWISDFGKWRISQLKTQINKLALNNRRLLIAAEFHFVHPVEKES